MSTISSTCMTRQRPREQIGRTCAKFQTFRQRGMGGPSAADGEPRCKSRPAGRICPSQGGSGAKAALHLRRPATCRHRPASSQGQCRESRCKAPAGTRDFRVRVRLCAQWAEPAAPVDSTLFTLYRTHDFAAEFAAVCRGHGRIVHAHTTSRINPGFM